MVIIGHEKKYQPERVSERIHVPTRQLWPCDRDYPLVHETRLLTFHHVPVSLELLSPLRLPVLLARPLHALGTSPDRGSSRSRCPTHHGMDQTVREMLGRGCGASQPMRTATRFSFPLSITPCSSPKPAAAPHLFVFDILTPEDLRPDIPLVGPASICLSPTARLPEGPATLDTRPGYTWLARFPECVCVERASCQRR